MLTFGPLAGSPLASGPLNSISRISGSVNLNIALNSSIKAIGSTNLSSSLIFNDVSSLLGNGHLSPSPVTLILSPSANISATASSNLTSSITFIGSMDGRTYRFASTTFNLFSNNNVLNGNAILNVNELGLLLSTEGTVSATGTVNASSNIIINDNSIMSGNGIAIASSNIIFNNDVNIIGIYNSSASSTISLNNFNTSIDGIGYININTPVMIIDANGGMYGNGAFIGKSNIDFGSISSIEASAIAEANTYLILDSFGHISSILNVQGSTSLVLLVDNSQLYSSIFGQSNVETILNGNIGGLGNGNGNLDLSITSNNGILLGSLHLFGDTIVSITLSSPRLNSLVYGSSLIKSDIFVPHLTAKGILGGTTGLEFILSSNYLNSILFGNSNIDINNIGNINGIFHISSLDNKIELFSSSNINAKAQTFASSKMQFNFGPSYINAEGRIVGTSPIIISPVSNLSLLLYGIGTSPVIIEVNGNELIGSGILNGDSNILFNESGLVKSDSNILGSLSIDFINSGIIHNYNLARAIKFAKVKLLSLENYKEVVEIVPPNDRYIVKLVKTTGRL